MLEYEISKRIKKLSMVLKESSVEYQISQEKDKSLKGLFEVKKQFVQLIKTFVKEDWVEKITEENIELADKEFIKPNLHEARADLVYRVKSENIYFILLEFQSSDDKKMPYRLLTYIMEIWRKYETKDKLPLVIPCVLYTGNVKWKEKGLRDLFNVSREMEKYIPEFEYILIDVNRYTDEELIKTSNLVSSVIYMAKSKDKAEVANKLKNIIKLISKLDKKEQEAFVRWAEVMFYKDDGVVYNYFEKNLKKGAKKEMALIDLIPGAIEIFREEGRVEGRTEGREEGKAFGKAEGRIIEKREMLIKILTKKLKSKPSEEILKLINKLDRERLEKIEDNIFEITMWDDVEEIII